MNDAPLTLKNVCYDVAPQTRILEHVSFSLKPHTITGLLGINGAGKSTLLAICAKQLLPTHGHVRHSSTGNVQPKQHLGYLPEVAPLIPSLSVEQYLGYVAKLRKVTFSEADLVAVLTECELLPRRKQRIATLSKGNRQRVGIAQAILHKPALLLLDEPMSGLDPSQIIHFRDILTRLKVNTTILFSTHILSEINTLCDQSIILHNKSIETIEHHVDSDDRYQVTLSGEITSEMKQNLTSEINAIYDDTQGLTRVTCASQSALHVFLSQCVQNNYVITDVSRLHSTPEQAFLDAIRNPTR